MDIDAVIDDIYKKTYPSKAQMLSILSSMFGEDEYTERVNAYYDKWFGDIYKAPRRRLKRYVRFNEIVVDRQHQMDLMEMPKESLHKWTYLLTYIDVASRRATAVGITSKSAASVLKALKKVHEDMRLPEMLQTDGGNEFKGVVDSYLDSIGVRHVSTLQKNHQAIVERFNQTLARPLFRYMDYTEVNSGKEGYRFNRWGDILDDVLKQYNNRYHGGLKHVPEEVYSGKVKLVAQAHDAIDEVVLPACTLVRVILDRSDH